MAPVCEGIPRMLKVSKCVILHRGDGIPVAKGICCNVSSHVMVGSRDPLGDNHVTVLISFSLCMANVLDNWRYSI